MALERPQPPSPDRGDVGSSGGAGVAVDCPTLVEYCTASTWSDGTARETSTVLIFFEAGLWKGNVNDRELKRKGWASGGTLEALLAALEAGLASGALDWRADKPGAVKRR